MSGLDHRSRRRVSAAAPRTMQQRIQHVRTTLRLAIGLGLALALTACAGRTPAAGPSTTAAPQVSAEAVPTTGPIATPTPEVTATPATFSFDPRAVESELAGVDGQLDDINSSINATDSATGSEGQQP